MADESVGCARPTGKVVGDAPAAADNPNSAVESKMELKEAIMNVKVGGKAPDFRAPSYYQGKFGSISLSDYLGKWVLLCFYPGDFTFV